MNGTSSTHQDKVLAEEQKTRTLLYIHIRMRTTTCQIHLKQEMSLKRQRQRNICIVIERLKYCDLSTGTLAFIYIYIDPHIGYV